MRILFYLVHPAKFQFHKVQIRKLKENGHHVDIIINSKDILEDLVREEGWEYVNLFPEGRKIKGVHVYIAAVLSIFRTVVRLHRHTRNKKYDLFIGDLLTVLGRLRRVPSLYPTDNVLRQVPEQSIFLSTANHIIAPAITNLGLFNAKKVNYDGYKALAHLHPNHFKPDRSILSGIGIDERFFLIRCTGFKATHDIGRSGIDDNILWKLVGILKSHGRIFITSERTLPEGLREYHISCRKQDIHHYMAFSDMFIGDSTTMCTEAALLGATVVEYDDYWHEIEQMMELQYKYGLINLFSPPGYGKMLEKVEELINDPMSRKGLEERRQLFINEKVDVSSFLVWFIENYPSSFTEYKRNPFIQYNFR